MGINTLVKLPDINIYYGDTAGKSIDFTDDANVAISFTGMDVEMGVSREQNPLIAAAPLFTVTGTVSGSVAGRVTFAISDASWSLIVDGNFDANGRYIIFYDVQQKDTGASTNKETLGKGRIIIERDIAT